MKKLLTIFALCTLVGANTYAAECYVEYLCGAGTGEMEAAEPTGTSFTPESPTGCTAPEGYTFSHWSVIPYTEDGGGLDDLSSYPLVAHPGETYSFTFADNTDTCDGLRRETSPMEYVDFDFTAEYVPIPNAAHRVIPTSKSYTDAQLDAHQPQFANLGNNKLMTYGTTDGAVGGRDIVTTLGSSTTATTVPTNGAIRTGLNTKQNGLHGPNGWVAINTGDNGVLGQKPVYSITNNYGHALVEVSTLNDAVIAAVNSELTEVPNVGWQINTVSSMPTLSTRAAPTLNAATNGTGYCFRRLNGQEDQDGTCSAATLSTLGGSGNMSGLWGAVMPYGDIVGRSVCSTETGSYGVATSTAVQESALDAEFVAQTGAGTPEATKRQCWCKMESVDGYPAVSRWVFANSVSSASACADVCAYYCGYFVQDYSAFRSGLFNSVQ